MPYRVVINEAVELAKSFGGTDGHKYVNGVLDKLAAALAADAEGGKAPELGSMPSEFELIATLLHAPARTAVLGVGDDCALIAAPTRPRRSRVTTDTLAEGTHFLPGADAAPARATSRSR